MSSNKPQNQEPQESNQINELGDNSVTKVYQAYIERHQND